MSSKWTGNGGPTSVQALPDDGKPFVSSMGEGFGVNGSGAVLAHFI